MRHDQWRAADPIDRHWRGIRFTRAYLGFDIPAADAIRDAVARLAPLAPEVARVVAPDGRWRRLAPDEIADWAADSVTTVDETVTDPARAFAQVPELGDRRLFRLAVGPGWIAQRVDHAVGDARTADLFVAHLVAQAASRRTLEVPWQRLGSARRDLEIARGVGRNLGSVRWVAEHRSELAGGVYGPMSADLRPVTVVDASDAAFMTRVRAARDAHFPGASAAAVVTAGLRAAVARELGEPRPGFECLFNTRVERPGQLPAWGNWSVGAYLRPTDDYAPAAVGAAMVEARQRGVAEFGLAAMRARRAPDGTGEARGVVAEGQPRLTVSFVRTATSTVLPGFEAGRSMVVTETVPNGPDTITFQAAETGGALVVSAAHFPEVWPTAALRSGVQSFLDDPLGLLLARGLRR